MTVGVIVVRAVQTTATFITVLLVGAWFSNHPAPPNQILDPVTLGKVSKLVMTVIGPLLVVVTVGSTVSTKMLQQEGWVLIVWSFIFMTVCFLVSCGVAAAARIKPAFRDEFVLAATFPNALAAPLVMMTTLCRQPPFVNGDYRAEPGDEEVTCSSQSLTYLFLYTTGWIFVFFATAYPHVIQPSDGEATGWWRSAKRRLAGIANANVLAVFVGFGIALVAPLKHELYSPNGSLLWLSSAAITLGGPLVGMSSLIVGGTLGATIRRAWGARQKQRAATATVVSPTVVFEANGGFDAPDQPSSTPGLEVPPQSTPGAGSSRQTPKLGIKEGSNDNSASEDPAEIAQRPSVRDQTVLVLTRMVVCPTVCVLLLIYTVDYMIPADVTEINGKLLRLVLILEAIVPSADFVIVLCIHGGRAAAAEALSVTYLWEYIAGIVTITFGVVVAMAWIGEG